MTGVRAVPFLDLFQGRDELVVYKHMWYDGCCRALKLPTMPSLSMHTKHGVVRRLDDGVLDLMVPHLQRGNGGR
jgi:hypothetical protein